MGSVDRDYRCPWCGRIGNGGYVPDGLDYPICTFGEFACLWRREDLPEFRKNQLKCILQGHPVLVGCQDVLFLVSEFIGPSVSKPQTSDKKCFLRRPVIVPASVGRASRRLDRNRDLFLIEEDAVPFRAICQPQATNTDIFR